MDLFEVVNKRAKPSVHALMIRPFKDIWEADSLRWFYYWAFFA